ncbi:MAG: integrase core domain-containing protein [Candidatus Melainabacteria bacterium]|nr:integrase core domain-containing protein [Candidatus Melainabacteria bacterium]
MCTALQDALSQRPRARPLVLSDRGSQYVSAEFRTILRRHRLKQSKSRRGECWDNAPTESFFRTLKLELDIYSLRPSATLREEIFEYIETFYNRRRLHSSLGYKTPEEFDNEYWSVRNVSTTLRQFSVLD